MVVKGTDGLHDDGDATEGGAVVTKLAVVVPTPCVGAAERPLENEVVAIAAIIIRNKVIDGGCRGKVRRNCRCGQRLAGNQCGEKRQTRDDAEAHGLKAREWAHFLNELRKP